MPQAEDFLAGIDLKPTRFNPLTDLSPIERFSLGLQEVGAGLQKAGGYQVQSPTNELVRQKMAEQALTNQSIIPMAQLKLHAAELAERTAERKQAISVASERQKSEDLYRNATIAHNNATLALDAVSKFKGKPEQAKAVLKLLFGDKVNADALFTAIDTNQPQLDTMLNDPTLKDKLKNPAYQVRFLETLEGVVKNPEGFMKSLMGEDQFEEYTLPDGSRWRVNKKTGERAQVSEPLKTAQPWTPTYIASVASGAIADPKLSASEAKKIQAQLATQAGDVAGQREANRILTQAKYAEQIRKTSYARAAGESGGRFDLDMPLSPAQNQTFGTEQGTTWRDVAGKFPSGQKARLAIEELKVSQNLVDTLSSYADRLITAKDWVDSNLQGATLTAGAWSRANPDAAVFADQREALLGVLSRQVGAERGVLTDRDIYRIDKMLPNFRDTKDIKDKKMAFVRSMISANREARIKSISTLLDTSGNAWEIKGGGGGTTPGAGGPGQKGSRPYKALSNDELLKQLGQ